MKKIILFTYLIVQTFLSSSQSVDFTYHSANGLYCNPSLVQFTQQSPGNPSGYMWNFGNGMMSNAANPLVTFANPGSYTVRLVVIYQQNTLEVTRTIVINPAITATVNPDRSYICTPGVVNFSSSANGNINAYTWDFGDGTTLTTSSGSEVSHNFSTYGEYSVTLKATDASGCYGNASTQVSVKKPSISGTLTPTSGCVPASVSLHADINIPANSTATYSWNFKDGSAAGTTTSGLANHVYNVAGTFAPILTITTNDGCTNNYTFDAVAFGTPPTGIVSYPQKQVMCGSESGVFIAKAVNANSYYWEFGDGISATTTDTVIHHKYARLGTKFVKVTPSYNGCKGNPDTFHITVIGVISSFDYANTCGDKKTFAFSNGSQGNLSAITWEFGDGSQPVNTQDVTHTFPATGTYETSLFVIDNLTGCSDRYAENIYTANPSLVNPDTSICKNSNTHFSIANNYNNPYATYVWNTVGTQVGPSPSPDLTIQATILGYHYNSVIINNGPQYCPDTIKRAAPVLVRGPNIKFTAPTDICFNSLYTVLNSSVPYRPADSIKLWYWDFGSNEPINNNYQPQPHAYANAGTYQVKLTGQDIYGCRDSLVKPVRINELPFLRLIPGIDTLCAGQRDSLIAFHTGSIAWSPANSISCLTCDTVLANPSVSTKYFVNATNSFGCTSKDSVFVKVFTPFSAKPLASDLYICLHDSTKLMVSPGMEKITWSPATGLSSANQYGPVASPVQTTRYMAMLSDSAGCFKDSAAITVHVKSLPKVDAGADRTCQYNAQFSFNPIYSNNVSNYSWTPASALSCNNCGTPVCTAAASTKYVIKVTSDSGCVARDSVTVFVECKDANILMPTAFSPNHDNLNDYYYPLTRGIRSIRRFSIYDRDGRLVYEATNFPPNNKAFGWNGRIRNSDQSTSVYVYFIDAICDIGQTVYSRGSVVLVK